MTDTADTKPWEPYYLFHDKDGQHFYFQRYGCITHCYRLGPYLDYNYDYHYWWKVLPIPAAELETLTEVLRDSEIEYQLKSLSQNNFPTAGVFRKKTAPRSHPRRNQWSELRPLEQKPESWEKCSLISSAIGTATREFQYAPFLHDDDPKHEVHLSNMVRKTFQPGSDDDSECASDSDLSD